MLTSHGQLYCNSYNRTIEFKVDTGANVTVIPESRYCPNEDGKLEPASIPLNGLTGEMLEVCGRFTAHVTRKGVESKQEIYVVRNLSRALLGRPAIQAFNVAVLIEPVQGDYVVEQFPELFKGLGKLKDSYKIKLREGATPFALTTPRRVPIPQIGGAKHFTKLDANSGYWQIKLDTESAKLTTFITPFCFNRLPFGITSAPEHFQRRMTEILGDIPGVVCLVDDILVTGRTQAEHDSRLRNVLTRLSKAGLTLGREKCEINKRSVKFVGQLVDELGVRPDPEKVRAIQQMKTPMTMSELRRFLGMTNQQSKFSPNLADHTKPLRDLLSKKNQWSWGHEQQQALSDSRVH